MKLRKIDISDVLSLQSISRQTFFDTFAEFNTEEDMRSYLENNLSIQNLSKEIQDPLSEFYFCEKNDTALGYLKVSFESYMHNKLPTNSMEIQRIYVLKDYLGNGVGQKLFKKAREIALEKNFDAIWLGVWEHNHRAIRFYEKNGFVTFGNHAFILGSDRQTDILMKLYLKNEP